VIWWNFAAIERVERDVDALDAALDKLGGIFRELRAIGRQRQLVEPAGLDLLAEFTHQEHDVLAHQRLAAGEPQLAHALGDEGGTEPVQFFERQQILLRQEGHVFRHAIGAAEIAAIGDRHAQIGNRPTEGVDHWNGLLL